MSARAPAPVVPNGHANMFTGSLMMLHIIALVLASTLERRFQIDETKSGKCGTTTE